MYWDAMNVKSSLLSHANSVETSGRERGFQPNMVWWRMFLIIVKWSLKKGVYTPLATFLCSLVPNLKTGKAIKKKKKKKKAKQNVDLFENIILDYIINSYFCGFMNAWHRWNPGIIENLRMPVICGKGL